VIEIDTTCAQISAIELSVESLAIFRAI